MFDTFNLNLSQNSVRDTDLLAEIPANLEDSTAYEKQDQVLYSGTLENLRNGVSEREVSINKIKESGCMKPDSFKSG